MQFMKMIGPCGWYPRLGRKSSLSRTDKQARPVIALTSNALRLAGYALYRQVIEDRLIKGCLTCRQRHLKCDKTGTGCHRCRQSGRKCLPAPHKPEAIAFRHGQNPSLREEARGPPRYGENRLVFPKDQVWVKMPSRVAFKDETENITAEYDVASIEVHSGKRKPPDIMVTRKSNTSPLSVPSSNGTSQTSPPPSQGCSSYAGTNSGSKTRLSSPDFSVRGQKLRNFNEALLLRHFRQVLGPWPDAYDYERHFS
ncbi:hypothetical protein VTN00DRAFT_3614 [Thermoascus crustaceus]|uniref:uncharacterized protein n=1 Tax=Thermoascus crustaceus TaxID=5088 RepID=UPI003744807F